MLSRLLASWATVFVALVLMTNDGTAQPPAAVQADIDAVVKLLRAKKVDRAALAKQVAAIKGKPARPEWYPSHERRRVRNVFRAEPELGTTGHFVYFVASSARTTSRSFLVALTPSGSESLLPSYSTPT